nr:unnamed protein product [Digitaria exilis]
MGLMSVEPSQIRDETTSGIDGEVVGRVRRVARSDGKRAASTSSNDVASTSRAKQPKRKRRRTGLAENSCTNDVPVISIFGIGGVGKTTLAQFIYNDPRVKHHFGVRIWVCVTNFFDKRRMQEEIIKSIPPIPGKEFDPSCTLDVLHTELMERLKC